VAAVITPAGGSGTIEGLRFEDVPPGFAASQRAVVRSSDGTQRWASASGRIGLAGL
jgi:hypothetical protein